MVDETKLSRRWPATAAASLLVSWASLAPQARGAEPTLAMSTVNRDRADIERVLKASAAGWSRGDLSEFMRAYEDSTQTAYVKATGVVRGYPAIHDMYAARFGGPPGAMGRLSMALLDYRRLGRDYALVTGRFDLKRPATSGGEAMGVFTLVFRKSAAGWRIISDHTD